jgi:hypothetical protein
LIIAASQRGRYCTIKDTKKQKSVKKADIRQMLRMDEKLGWNKADRKNMRPICLDYGLNSGKGRTHSPKKPRALGCGRISKREQGDG